jgi:hypothetical protein
VPFARTAPRQAKGAATVSDDDHEVPLGSYEAAG